MADYAELKLTHRIFMQNYPFSLYAIKDNPIAKLKKPISESKFALITTAGLRMPEDAPYDNTYKLGDCSFREIPNNIDPQILTEDHKSSSFDHSGIEADKNLALPIDRFRDLEKKGIIGELNHRSFSFMGSIIAPGRLINETSKQVASILKEDKVDCVFLTPV
jgi:D-proline reductase (dithiol) PrdB